MNLKFLIACVALSLSACGTLQPHEKIADSQATQAGLVATKKSSFDTSYVLPAANAKQYKKVLLNDLDLSNVKITRSSVPDIHETPWELNDGDKVFFQEKYRQAAEDYLFKNTSWSATNVAASDTLILKMKIVEIAPLGSKDDSKGRPQRVDVYTQGFGRMTAVIELYDSTNNTLIALASDEQELGFLWEKNDRVQNNIRIKLAFEQWMRKLSKELPLWTK
jgi:hypothetical protein